MIFFDEGWSPQEAGNYLEEFDISAPDYHPSHDQVWWATSNYRKLGDNTLNTLSLRLYGNTRVVTRMKLSLAIWNLAERKDAEVIFAEIGQLLIARAIDPDVARKFAETGVGKSDYSWTENGLRLSIETENNTSSLSKHLRIQHSQDTQQGDF